MGKVIHISDELHGLIKKHCESEGIAQSVWANKVLLEAFGKEAPKLIPKAPKPKAPKKPDPVPVEKKTHQQLIGDRNGNANAWEREPFWKDSQEERQDKLEGNSDESREETRGHAAAIRYVV